MNDLLLSKKWRGDFFLPEKYDTLLSGEIEYSPNTGVTLECSSIFFHDKDYKKPELIDNKNLFILHGILENGKKCTLCGLQYSHKKIQSIYENLTHSSYQYNFRFLLVGHHLNGQVNFPETYFSIYNSQEIFHWSALKNETKIEDEPIIYIKVDYGKISILQDKKFSYLSKDVSSKIHSDNKKCIEKIKEFFESIENECGSSFFVKEDVKYIFKITFDEELPISRVYEKILDVMGLFAIFNYQPTFIESMSLKHGKMITDVYPALSLTDDAIKISSRVKRYSHLPVNLETVDFQTAISNWTKASDKYKIIESIIQRNDGHTGLGEIYGKIIIYATQLEYISKSEGNNCKENKFQYAIDNYCFSSLKSIFMEDFPNYDFNEIGQLIYKVRTEVAHPVIKRKALKALGFENIFRLSRFLEIVVIGHILIAIGIDENIVEYYQKYYY